MKRTIYLVDPAGGGIQQSPGLIVVQHKILSEVGSIDLDPEKITNPGELRTTQAALDQLGERGVCMAFINHLLGNWWSDDPDDNTENDAALATGGTIYNVDLKRRIMCITYPGDNTTLITSEEY
jgi:hypothetical protein